MVDYDDEIMNVGKGGLYLIGRLLGIGIFIFAVLALLRLLLGWS